MDPTKVAQCFTEIIMNSPEFIRAKHYMNSIQNIKIGKKKKLLLLFDSLYCGDGHSDKCKKHVIRMSMIHLRNPEEINRTCMFEVLTHGLSKCGCRS